MDSIQVDHNYSKCFQAISYTYLNRHIYFILILYQNNVLILIGFLLVGFMRVKAYAILAR